MRNITISIDDETYRRARLWAAERDTSVSAIVKCILTTLPARMTSKPVPAPPPPHETGSGSIQAVAESQSEPMALIPSWGLSVLRTTLAHFQTAKSQKSALKSSAGVRSVDL
jgi:hypothetical protein